MPNKVPFAERLKEALVIKGVKQNDLSRMIGCPKSAISQYCTGLVIPKQRWTHAIALALNVSEAWLMGYDVPMDRNNENSLLAEGRIRGIMSVLGEIGALDDDGFLSESGREVVTDLLKNNANMLKKLINDEN